MEISGKIEKFIAVPDPVTNSVVLKIEVRVNPEDAMMIARKIELAATDAIGVSA